jgi:hypothetical protein
VASPFRSAPEPSGALPEDPVDRRPAEASGTGPGGAPAVRARLVAATRSVAPAAGIYAASRAVVLVAMWLASRIHTALSFHDAFLSWDGTRYIGVVTDGYPRFLPLQADGRAAFSNLGFFPLFPLCIRAVRWLGFSPLAAGLIVVGLAGVAASVLLWVLLERLWGRDVAARGVALFCFFPGAVVLSLVYSEPLMLALSIGCLLALLQRRWVLGGVLAGLATATRPNALVLVAVCAWAALVALYRRREWPALAAPVLAPVGFVAFQVFLRAHTGALDAYFRTQREAWDETMAPGVLRLKLRLWLHHPFLDVNLTLTLACTIFLVVAVVLLVRARPPGVILVYAGCLAVLTLSSTSYGGQPRFLLTAFPFVVVPARYLRGAAFTTTLACSACVLGALTVLTLTTTLATP